MAVCEGARAATVTILTSNLIHLGFECNPLLFLLSDHFLEIIVIFLELQDHLLLVSVLSLGLLLDRF